MNDGWIEQAGTPREIFNAPRTEFVARFIGGHNVIAVEGRKASVRTDRIRLLPAATGAQSHPVTVRDVEYQGTAVFVSLLAETGLELTAVVPERTFYDRPFAVGEAAAVEWDQADIHELAA
jgi:putative spermidine/putrescine transport system ATP-binding protein